MTSPDTDAVTPAERFERNLQALAPRFPDLHRRMRAMPPPLSQIVWDAGQAVDINLRSGALYKLDARSFAARQVEEFASNPPRLYYALPQTSNFDSMVSRRMFDELMLILKQHGVDTLAQIPSGTSGYLVVLGVGLGHHLLPLLRQLPALHLVIVEPFEEFFYHSLHAIDWTEIFDHCDRAGMSIHLECAREPNQMFKFIADSFDSHAPSALDGTAIFAHYNLWQLTEVHRLIINEMPRRMVSVGYYEDERKMIWNTATNLQQVDFRLLEGKLRPRGSVPVFLLGAGPSFDETAHIVRQWRDHAIIITSGSALPAALRHGIIPDFHTEIENGPDQYDKTMYVLERFPDLFPEGRLTGIRLIASTTLNPRVAPLFDEVYFFFRGTVCSTSTFAGDIAALRGAAPTVANTSLVSAACLGFGDVYLFGFDCGWRNSAEHHAKETIYYGAEGFKLEQMEANYILPGNFGGQVESELIFDWSRNIMQSCIPAYHLNRVFNCSDGALIEGTTPKAAEALEFTTPIDREAMLTYIRMASPFYPAGAFLKDFDVAPLRVEVNAYVDALFAILDQGLAENASFTEVEDRVWELISGLRGNHRLASMIFFSTQGEIRKAKLFISRIKDDDSRAKVTADLVRLLRTVHEEMRDETLTILDELEGLLAGRLVPEWTKGLPTTPGTSY